MIVVITRVAELVVAEFMFAEFVPAIAALVGVGGTRGSRHARQGSRAANAALTTNTRLTDKVLMDDMAVSRHMR